LAQAVTIYTPFFTPKTQFSITQTPNLKTRIKQQHTRIFRSENTISVLFWVVWDFFPTFWPRICVGWRMKIWEWILKIHMKRWTWWLRSERIEERGEEGGREERNRERRGTEREDLGCLLCWCCVVAGKMKNKEKGDGREGDDGGHVKEKR